VIECNYMCMCRVRDTDICQTHQTQLQYELSVLHSGNWLIILPPVSNIILTIFDKN
jgi:hypothetical protein